MNAMNIPTGPAPQPAATAPAAANAASDAASDNFMLMLGQLLGAPVTPGGSGPKTTVLSAVDREGDALEAAQDAAAMMGIPMPVLAPLQVQLPESSGDLALQLSTVSAQAGGAAGARAGLEMAAELLATKTGDDGASSPAPSAGPSQSPVLDPASQLRSAVVADTATSRPLQHPVGTSAWADEVGTRMIMMTDRGQHSASLRLSPEHLGPLEVRIAVRDDQASVWFGAAHADTRAAIEQALPRLRELFASQGLSLADAGVHHQAPRDQGRHASASLNGGLSAADEAGAISSPIAIKLGLIDAYA
jgi:flagellar hook-length control protein FliK